MSILGYKRLAVVLLTFLAIESAALLSLSSRIAAQHQKIKDAYGLIGTYRDIRDMALTLDPKDSAGMLRAMFVHPTDTNDLVDLMVERVRRQDAKDVVAYLRQKTGENLGDEPTNWVQINNYDYYWKKR